MDEADRIIMQTSLQVTEEVKLAIKGISEMYKEFRSNGLKKDEALALIKIMLNQNRG